jgi:aldehyde:ferredoxin oxidoreductase
MENKVVTGYNGKILRVNLSTNTIAVEDLDPKVCRQYLGGAGFVAYFLWKELKPGIDALSPDNKLIFALGPATGLTLPGASRNCIGAKSPLTGGIAKSEVGGFWMVELKRAGFDAVIVEGKAEKPVYLWVHDGEVSIRDASHLWGKETIETEAAIRTELGDEHIHVAMIGQAGENLVRYACVMEGCHDAAGRGGVGAVMGSKNLKAIAARGHNQPPVADAEKIKAMRQMMNHPHPISEFGTGGPQMLHQLEEGDLPTRNFRDGDFKEVTLINGGVIKDTVRVGMEGCFACPYRCKKIVKFEAPYKVDPVYGGPEYETLAALGSDVGVSDLKAILKGNERCNAYSLDSISTGSTIAFAIECYEKGLITKKDTGGLELKWGDAAMMLELIELIAHGKGFGKVLGEGTARMAKKIGKGCEEFAMHTKGLEPGMHDPRTGSFLFMGYLVSPTGADHCCTDPDGMLASDFMFAPFHTLGWDTPPKPLEITSRKIGIFKDAQFVNMLHDSVLVCHFPGFDFNMLVDLVKATTGWDTGLPELMRISERIVTLMRLFNLREGLTVQDDKMSERYYQPTKNGTLATAVIDREAYHKARLYYYTIMGWDKNGVPLKEKVEELCIS